VTDLDLTATDFAIIRCLTEDARSPVAKIAERLRMPESTVRHRLNRLVRSKIVRFATLTNPHQFGYLIWAHMEIQAELSKVRLLAERLAAAPEIYFVSINGGAYEVMATGVFRSNEQLFDFITGRLSKIPGIIHASTSIILQVVKRTMTFDVPDELLAQTSNSRKRLRGRRLLQASEVDGSRRGAIHWPPIRDGHRDGRVPRTARVPRAARGPRAPDAS
jgi:Lrp/AsnC family transcriptional regulator for asnA, asnC and gidA